MLSYREKWDMGFSFQRGDCGLRGFQIAKKKKVRTSNLQVYNFKHQPLKFLTFNLIK